MGCDGTIARSSATNEPAACGARRQAAPEIGCAVSRPIKRSFTIAGHRTSISLEAAFWEALKAAASEEQMPVARLVARIDDARGGGGLSSAVRVWILQHYRASTGR